MPDKEETKLEQDEFENGANDTATNTVPVFIGDAQVTVTDGFPLGPGESATIPVTGEAPLYAVASAASQKIAWAII